ncbi:MAG: EamA family transporter [Acidobacteriota bacterium]
MSLEPTALLVVLACAFAWVGLDLLRKLLVVRGGALPITFLMVAAQVPLFFLWVLVDGRWTIGTGYWLPGLICIAINLGANLAYMRSVKLSPMSATLPLLSLTPVFASLAAIPLLAEIPRAAQAAGISIVVLGALVLNAEPESGGFGGLWRGLLSEKGAPWMVATALFWSISPALEKLSMRHAAPSMHAFVMVTGIVCGLGIALAVQGRLGEVGGLGHRGYTVLAASAVVSCLALFFQLLAIQMVQVGLVETTKRGIGAAMALLLGRLVFGEELSRQRMVAVALMVVGVWLVLA